jgi:hypothetical protein
VIYLLKNKTRLYLGIICLLLFLSSISWAAKPAVGEIEPGIYSMMAITNHIPFVYKKDTDYWKLQQKVDLKVGNLEQFKDVPKLGLKNPYTGIIELGDKPGQRFGVIVDIVGEEKRLYVDTNGDGSFAGETWVPLLNEWYGSQNYWISAPEPIKLLVGYKSKPDQRYPIEISASGALIEPGTIKKECPYLMIQVRTWFLAKIIEDGAEKMVAIVDHNNNGRFNDPEDELLIDYNNDSFFNINEALTHKKGIEIKSGKQKLTAEWDVYPDKLVIGGKNSDK